MISKDFQKSIHDNSNINEYDKKIIVKLVQKIDELFTKCSVDIQYENSNLLFKNLTVSDVIDGASDYIVKYDEDTNTIIQNFGHENFDLLRYESEYIDCLLKIISKKYNFENKKYDNGLEFDTEYMTKRGTKLNEKLNSYISTLITGYSKDEKIKDFYYDTSNSPYTMDDVLIKDMCDIFGSSKILNYFINCEGRELFFELSSILGEEQANDFYNSMDDYEFDRVKNRKQYDSCINQLKQKYTYDGYKM